MLKLLGNENAMIEINNKQEQCTICKQEYTSVHTEVAPGVKIYVCDNCLESAKHNFIWVCMGCGKVFLRPKKMVIERTTNFELKRAYMLCEDMQIIQGIDMCIGCDPEGVMNYVSNQKMAMEC
jgi:ribosomal protein L37AE/L43A